ncbi:MAG: nicotinate phosphoribosyltransferase [Bacillota bacterium]|nr:nicotinate phosphoribosyltransferase [Bacillota bacterium]
MTDGNVQRLRTLDDVRALAPRQDRLYSAEHAEILAGATSDVYFVKTQMILESLGRADAPVAAEIFATRAGVLAGVEEALNLLRQVPGLSVEALPEGEEVEAKEVVMRIRGPYSAFGIYETALLGILASSSGWATAARRVKEAAGSKPVICFGARHVHPAVAPVLERAALVGGADGVSCILAARQAGRQPMGTIPHAAILIVGDTLRVAEAYDRLMPPDESRTILVDTFHDEVEETLRVARALGEHLQAVRLDTPSERGSVTPDLVRELRARLDQEGFRHVGIFVSGGLTEERVRALAEAGADGFGVGSYISAAPPLDMTMDVKEVDGRPLAKRGRIPGVTPNPRLVRRL